MTEPLRNHGDHGGATAVYAVQAAQWHRASGVTGVLPYRRGDLTSDVTVPEVTPYCVLLEDAIRLYWMLGM